jgi:tRNA A-37 threonylcarbamoyl transferase component Bud32
MNYSDLEKFSCSELKQIAIQMGLLCPRGKDQLIKEITTAFKEYEIYKTEKIDKYCKGEQLGEKGKEGTTFLVTRKDGAEYAMKTFKKQKSSSKMTKEAELQKLAADFGASPNVIDIDTVSKYIVMEKMDVHLVDLIKAQGGILTKQQQKHIISIYKKLDKAGVFHGDANLLNYMYKGNKMYIIDFGMAREITKALINSLGTEVPNMHIMTLGLALKLRELKFPPISYEYIVEHLSDEQRMQYGFSKEKIKRVHGSAN